MRAGGDVEANVAEGRPSSLKGSSGGGASGGRCVALNAVPLLYWRGK
jgi:hypothetical protein